MTSYANYDKLLKNSEEVYRLYADQEMGKTKNFQVSAAGDNTEIKYTKTYTGGERVARFLQGVGLTLGALSTGMFVDRQIRNKFAAARGEIEKKVLIPNSLFSQVIQDGNVVVPEQLEKSRAYEYAFAAEKKLKEGRTQEAVTMLLSITSENPTNAFALGLLGEATRRSADKENIDAAIALNLLVPVDESTEELSDVAQKQGLSVEKISEHKQAVHNNPIVCQYSQGEIRKIREFLESGPVSDYVADEDIEKKIAELGEFGTDRVGDENLSEIIEKLGTDLVGSQAAVACAVICLKVMESFFINGLPKDEREIYQLIDSGVNTYTEEYKDAGLLDFGEVYTRSLSPELTDQIMTVIPMSPEGISQDMVNQFMVFLEVGDVPPLAVSTHLDVLLTALQNSANETEGKTCAVLTTQTKRATNATFVIMFDENKKPVLFNSHGETYNDKEQGASLLRFESMEELSKYVKDTFFKNEDGEFQLKIVSTLR